MTPNRLSSIHARVVGERNNTIIPNSYIKLTGGDYAAAAVLKEIVYWSEWAYDEDRDGWFYRQEDEWQSRCFLSRKQVNRAISVLNRAAADAGLPELVKKAVRKIRGEGGTVLTTTATHYRLDRDTFTALLDASDGRSGNSPQGNSGNGPSGKSGNSPSGKSLTYTAETTAETDSGNAPDGAAPAASDVPTATPAAAPARKPKANEREVQLIEAYMAASGKPFPAAAGKAINMAKALVRAGVTPDDVTGCTNWLMSDRWWQSKGFDWGTVVGQIDKWRGRAEPEPVARSRNQQAQPLDVVAYLESVYMDLDDEQLARVAAGEAPMNVLTPDQRDWVEREQRRRAQVADMARTTDFV